MSFLQLDRWLESHYVEVTERITRACGRVDGKTVLDVGAGEMLTDFALAAEGARVTGLDLAPEDHRVDKAFHRLLEGGFNPRTDYAERVDYKPYDGVRFPFENSSFDLVISVGVFEHVAKPLAVLREMRRVARGAIYIHAYPWWTCFYGSHLTDFIKEPFFHLKRDKKWVRAQLDAYIEMHPAEAGMVNHIYREFLTLNRYTQSMFLRDVRAARLRPSMCELISYRQNLAGLPDSVSPLDAMICGTETVLHA